MARTKQKQRKGGGRYSCRSSASTFRCTAPGCIAAFLHQKQIEQHLLYSNHFSDELIAIIAKEMKESRYVSEDLSSIAQEKDEAKEPAEASASGANEGGRQQPGKKRTRDDAVGEVEYRCACDFKSRHLKECRNHKFSSKHFSAATQVVIEKEVAVCDWRVNINHPNRTDDADESSKGVVADAKIAEDGDDHDADAAEEALDGQYSGGDERQQQEDEEDKKKRKTNARRDCGTTDDDEQVDVQKFESSVVVSERDAAEPKI